MNTFKKIHSFEIMLMSNMGTTEHGIFKILPFSVFTSIGSYNYSRGGAFFWI